MKASDQLNSRFNQLKSQGLVDMKFYLGRGASEATVEIVCTEVNRIDDFIDRGEFKMVSSWAGESVILSAR